jgi:FAD/FMN-containing dehydrogenase
VSENKGLIGDLVSIVGKENASGNIFERVSYGQDAAQPDLDPEKIPLAVVKPVSVQGVSEVLKYANKKGIPVYIHGAGTAF